MRDEVEATLPRYIRFTGKRLLLDLLVSPGAQRSEVVGILGDRIKIKVKAPPEDGAANREVVRLLASSLDLSPRDIWLARGTSSRQKTVAISESVSVDMARLRGLGRQG